MHLKLMHKTQGHTKEMKIFKLRCPSQLDNNMLFFKVAVIVELIRGSIVHFVNNDCTVPP